MGRTFIRQDAQVRNSVTYDDTVAAGSTLESAPTSIEGDLNGLRSQMKRAIYADSAGDWFADIPTVNSKKRAISSLNTDLDDIEEKRLLFRAQVLTDISVTAAQNWEILSVAGSEAPSQVRASGATTNGAICATSAFSGAGFAAHELVETAGVNAIAPKNLCVVRDSTTGQVIQSSGRDVYALLQAESTGSDGAAFDDTSAGNRVKLSFVRLTVGLDDLEACPVADIAGLTINYVYVRRINFDAIPEQAFLGDSAFIDQSASVDVTLDNAIDNQSGAASQAQDIDWRITDTFTLDFQTSDGGVNLLRIMPNAAGDEIEVNVDTLDVNTVNDSDFSQGATFDSGGTGISVGVTAGYISTAAADFGVRAGAELYLDDANQTGSTWAQTAGIKLSDTTAEWDAFETAFGEVSLLNAIVASYNASSRTRADAVVSSAITANTLIEGPNGPGSANLDVDLVDYRTKTFVSDVEVFINGQLMRNGANAAANNDVYPSAVSAEQQYGCFYCEFALVAAPGNPDQITMFVN